MKRKIAKRALVSKKRKDLSAAELKKLSGGLWQSPTTRQPRAWAASEDDFRQSLEGRKS